VTASTGLRVLIGCERSGAIRREFEKLGHEAWSCDTAPAEDGSNRHIRCDVREAIHMGFDLLALFHTPCPMLCNSGSKHLYIGCKKENGRNEARFAAMEEAAALYRYCRDEGDIPCRAMENPVMHRHAIEATGRGYTQFVHPYFFGDPFFKLTGFELVNLPDLRPTNKLTPPRPRTDEHKRWSACHRAAPGPNRAIDRARTYPGIAAACARQWGDHALAIKHGASIAPSSGAGRQFDLFREREAA
jgi:hypothetical protein